MTELTVLTDGQYAFVGGGAGGDANFQHRRVFCGTSVVEDGIVALEMLSAKPIGISAKHGWQRRSGKMRVTQSAGTTVHSLNAEAAAEVFHSYAEETEQKLDPTEPLPFFINNVLGIETGGAPKLRVPLALTGEGGVLCANEVPEGAVASIMGADLASVAKAAGDSTRDAIQQLGEHRPAVALFFDCVATRARLGQDFQFELDAVSKELGGVPFAGCNSIGQITRLPDQVGGFQNCTAVVCVLPA